MANAQEYKEQLSTYTHVRLIEQLRSVINSMGHSTSPSVYKDGAIQVVDEIEKRLIK